MYTQDTTGQDRSAIRSRLQLEDIRLRGRGMSPARLREIKRGLLTLHTLELMAVNIYRFQITGHATELNRQLIAAMCNEMTHVQDFQVKLMEFGWRPSVFRFVYWIVGCVLGFASRCVGPRVVLKADVWFETKAVSHYSELLRTVDWDEDTRRFVTADRAHEQRHATRWKGMLEVIRGGHS